MIQVFQLSVQQARTRSGVLGTINFWLEIFADWIRTVPAAHLEQGPKMKNTAFFRLSGWSMMLAGLLGILLIRIPEPEVIREILTGILSAGSTDLIQTLSQRAAAIVMVLVLSLLVLGISGLRSRHRADLGRVGHQSLYLAMAGAGLALAAIVDFPTIATSWPVFAWGLFGGIASLGVFVLTQVRSGVLGRSFYVLFGLLVGTPLLLLAVFVLDLNFSEPVLGITALISFLCVMVLGYKLQQNASEPNLAAV